MSPDHPTTRTEYRARPVPGGGWAGTSGPCATPHKAHLALGEVGCTPVIIESRTVTETPWERVREGQR